MVGSKARVTAPLGYNLNVKTVLKKIETASIIWVSAQQCLQCNCY